MVRSRTKSICKILLYLIVRKIDLLGGTAKIRDTLCSAADDANWMSQCHLLWQYIAIPDIDGGAKVSRSEPSRTGQISHQINVATCIINHAGSELLDKIYLIS